MLAWISHRVPSATAASAAVDSVCAQDLILNVLIARLRSNPSALLATATHGEPSLLGRPHPRYETW